MVRAGSADAQTRADEFILGHRLGLSRSDRALLATSADILRDRRSGKGRD